MCTNANLNSVRTYQRRPIQPSPPLFISCVTDRCRLCLGTSDMLHPIFDNMNCITLATRIFSCLSVQVDQNKHLPLGVCDQCLVELDKFYEFRKKCQMNDQKLKKHLRIAELRDVIEKSRKVESDKHSSTKVNTLVVNEEIESSQCISKHEVETQIGALIREALERSVVTTNSDSGALAVTQGAERTIRLFTKDHALITLQLEEEEIEKEDKKETVVCLSNEASQSKLTCEGAATCQYCHDLTFADFKSLTEHIMTNHTSDTRISNTFKYHPCDYCEKLFHSKSELQRHLRTHTGERPFTCTTCSKHFSQKDVLHRHTLVHLEKRPHACDVCSKSFTQRGALIAHANSHVPPLQRTLRKSSCLLCPKVFCHPSGLTRHMKFHAGKRFTCVTCGQHFSDQSAVRRHTLAQHTNK